MRKRDDESQVTEPEPTQEEKRFRVDELGKAAGLLPEFAAGGGPTRRQVQNPQHWLYRAVCVRRHWNEHTMVTEGEFKAAVAEIAHFTV